MTIPDIAESYGFSVDANHFEDELQATIYEVRDKHLELAFGKIIERRCPEVYGSITGIMLGKIPRYNVRLDSGESIVIEHDLIEPHQSDLLMKGCRLALISEGKDIVWASTNLSGRETPKLKSITSQSTNTPQKTIPIQIQQPGTPSRSSDRLVDKNSAQVETKPLEPNRSDSSTSYWLSNFQVQEHLRKSSDQVITTNVVGVTYEGRQAVIAELYVGETILLKREPANVYDCNAIMVIKTNGQQLGYIKRDMASWLARYLDCLDVPVQGVVQGLTGGCYPGSSLGVVIQFPTPTNDTADNDEEY